MIRMNDDRRKKNGEEYTAILLHYYIYIFSPFMSANHKTKHLYVSQSQNKTKQIIKYDIKAVVLLERLTCL